MRDSAQAGGASAHAIEERASAPVSGGHHQAAEQPADDGRRNDVLVADETLRDVLICILTSDFPPSRKEIARQLDRSQTTVSRAVAWLVARQYVHEDEQRAAGRAGRRETPLVLNSDRAYFIGISIRAPHAGDPGEVAGVLMNLAAQDAEKRIQALDGTDEPAVVDAVVNVVTELTKLANPPSRVIGLGVAMGGHVDGREGLVRYSWNFDPPWKGVSLRRSIQDATNLPTILENNANALAFYEQWFGQGRGLSDFAVVWVDAGVGFGIVSDGELRRGATGLAGELGHWRTKNNTLKCECGRDGCVEALIREATAKLHTRDPAPVVEAGEGLGRALAILQLAVDPERIIVSGVGRGLVNEGNFRAAVSRSLEEYGFASSGLRDLIVWGTLEAQKVALGAASMSLRSLSIRNLVQALDAAG